MAVPGTSCKPPSVLPNQHSKRRTTWQWAFPFQSEDKCDWRCEKFAELKSRLAPGAGACGLPTICTTFVGWFQALTYLSVDGDRTPVCVPTCVSILWTILCPSLYFSVKKRWGRAHTAHTHTHTERDARKKKKTNSRERINEWIKQKA